MARQHRNNSDIEYEVEAVLAGRGATARRLIELIHEVNPTDRGFAPDERQRRYKLKSRLQSALVRRYCEELAVLPDSRPGIALLRHRFLGRDACHVLVAELEDDARGWAQLQLDAWSDATFDEPQAPAAVVAPEPRPARPPTTLERARAALASYDYEQAHELLTAAVVEAQGTGAAPLLLLELLVDTLALDTEALEAERAFSPRILKLPEVRLLLAVAAARLGRRGRAEELLAGLDSPRVAEVWCLLAGHALRAGEDEEVEALLAKAEARSAGSPHAAQLRADLARRREERLRPMSENLARCFEAGDLDSAGTLARELLALQPEHALAGRILRELEARGRAEKARSLLGECERAIEGKEPSLAASLLAQAAAFGADPGELPQRITTLEAAARERARRARREAVAALLAGRDRDQALGAWLELDELSRRELRERTGIVMLDWLEELGAPGSAGRARPLIEALIAFAAARREPEDDRPELLEARLSTLDKQLRGLKAYRRFLGAVRARVLVKQRAEAAAMVAACRRALAEGRRDEALALLGRLEATPGAAGLGAQLEPLRAEIARLARLQQLAALAAREDGVEALFEARKAAEQLAREQSGAERERWAARVAELTSLIQREFRVRVDEVDLGLQIADLGRQLAKHQQIAGQWVDDTGDRVFLASAFGRWIFVREIDLAAARVRRQLSLRAPRQAGLVNWQVDGETLWLTLQTGWSLELSWKSGRVLGWHHPTDAGPLSDSESCFVAPGSRVAWTGLMRCPGLTACDLDSAHKSRLVGSPVILQMLPGSTEAAVASLTLENGCRLFTASGASVSAGRGFGVGRLIVSLAVHPRGHGFVALEAEKIDDETRLHGRLWVGDPTSEQRHDVSDGGCDFTPVICTSLEARCCFVLLFRPDPQPKELVAFGWREGALQELFRLEVPADAQLAGDAQARWVVLSYSTYGERRLVRLTEKPPQLQLEGSEAWVRATLAQVEPCSVAGRAKARGELESAWPELVGMKSPARKKRVRQLLGGERLLGDPGRLVTLACRLEVLNEPALHLSVAETAHHRHPTDPRVCLCFTEVLMKLEKWVDAQKVLENVRDPSVLGEDAEHYHHLLGEALMRQGNREGALKSWQAGKEVKVAGERKCGFYADLYLARPQEKAAPEEQWGPGSPWLAQLKNGLLASDERLAAGDALGAVRAVECPRDVTFLDAQCLARLAAAWLELEPADAGQRLRKTVALAAMVCVEDPDNLLGRSDRPFHAAWDKARLADLAARAGAWLEEHG